MDPSATSYISPDPRLSSLDTEIELITSSLLPSETFTSSPRDQWPRIVVIASTSSRINLNLRIDGQYPRSDAVKVQIKGDDMDRDEAEGWKDWVNSRIKEWEEARKDDPHMEHPLFHLLHNAFLPLLAPGTPSPSPPPTAHPEAIDPYDSKPHHCLLTSHHLLSPSKRRDLISLASRLSLVGLAKTGHPGIMYATGHHEDLVEWLREVKSWEWLALRVRIAIEPVPEELLHEDEVEHRGEDDTAEDSDSGGKRKRKGSWMEVEKINEALEWMKERGRDKLLLDIGMGSGKG